LLASSCASSEGATKSSTSSKDRPGPQVTAPTTAAGLPEGTRPLSLRWEGCDEVGPGLQCATLEVPLDWDAPDATITLALAKAPASGNRIGSLITNPGGPGASGLRFLATRPFADAVTERFDVVSWDPRGVGRSTALQCGTQVPQLLSLDPEPDDDAEQLALERAADQVARQCGRDDGELLAHLATDAVARDLEAIRLALGGAPLNYVGFSYGTQIGQEYADRFPDAIRAMVLDSVVDPALGFEDFLIDQAAAFDRSFRRNAAACEEAGRERCGVPDLDAAYDRVLQQLEDRPLDDAGPAELVTGTVLTGYVTDGWAMLGPALASALEGDGSPLRRLADAYRDFGGYTAYAAVVCTDSAPPAGHREFREFAERAARVSPRFGASFANELLPCATWPVPASGRPREIRAEAAPPLLLVAATGDPATPYRGAVEVARRIQSAVLLTVDLDGHGSYTTSRCVRDHVHDYLISLRLPEAGTRCT
jgi:pimeloyl-ACP methyl ester carboxylesterase